MNKKEWRQWKKRDLFAVTAFTIAYILTIPVRDYSFLDPILDTTQGIPFAAHLAIIIIGAITLLIVLEILSRIVKIFKKK